MYNPLLKEGLTANTSKAPAVTPEQFYYTALGRICQAFFFFGTFLQQKSPRSGELWGDFCSGYTGRPGVSVLFILFVLGNLLIVILVYDATELFAAGGADQVFGV